MKQKKTWREKLHEHRDLPRVEPITGKMSSRWGSGTVLIPSPLEVDAMMKLVPKGKVITIAEIRAALARRHGATIACPITTGIFAWIAANAAADEESQGVKGTTPYWRTLKTGGQLNPRYPGGVDGLRLLLESEGHQVVAQGKHFKVANYQERLCTVPEELSAKAA